MATGVIAAALAIAAPVAEASAATPRAVPLPVIVSAPYLNMLAPWLADPSVGPVELAYGGFDMGNVLNGGTTVVVSTAPAQGNTISSP